MLDIEAGLEAVLAPDVAEVVDDLRDVLLEVEARVALAGAGQRGTEAGDARDRGRRTDAGFAVPDRLLMTMGVLDAQFVQLVVANRGDRLAGERVHRVEEVSRTFHGVHAAARVIGRVVVKLNPADGETVRVVQLVVALRHLELRGLDVRDRRRLGLEAKLRHDVRADRDQTVRRQVATGLLPAAVEEQLVLQDRTTQGGGAGVDLRLGLLRGGGNRRAVGRRRGAAAAEEEREGAEVPAAEQVTAAAVEGVGARRGNGVVDHAHGLAELRREPRGDDLHFLDHHFGQRQQTEAGAVLLGVGVAVDLVVDAHRRAVGGETRHTELDVLGAGHTGLRQREVVRVTGDLRQVAHFELGHGVPDVDTPQFHGRCLRGDFDRLADDADFHRDVHDGGRTDGQLQVVVLHLLEALELGHCAVVADGEKEGTVEPILVGHE